MSAAFLVSYGVLWFLVLALTVLLLLLYRQMGEMYLGTREGRSRDGIAVGHRAPEFTLLDQHGERVSVPGGSPSLIIFGLPTCGPCRKLMPELATFAHENVGRIGVYFVAGENVAENREFAGDYNAPFPVLTQPGLSVAGRYKVRSSPFAFYIDADGIVQAKSIVNRLSQLRQLTMPEPESAPPTASVGAGSFTGGS